MEHKALLTRPVLTAPMRTPSALVTVPGDPGRRLPAKNGVHAERSVTAERLRMTGTIDQLVVDETAVTVTDFKTGSEDEAHEDLLSLYALLWRLDEQTNPGWPTSNAAKRGLSVIRATREGPRCHAIAVPRGCHRCQGHSRRPHHNEPPRRPLPPAPKPGISAT